MEQTELIAKKEEKDDLKKENSLEIAEESQDNLGDRNKSPLVNKCPFFVKEDVDCLDTEKKWLNGEIIGISETKVYIHYTGFSDKWNEWIKFDSKRIQHQWKPGRPFYINNRIDVKDTVDKWLEAIVVGIKDSGKVIRVHYKGYTAKWEEDLPIDSNRIAQIGYHSKAHGSGRKLRSGNLALNSLTKTVNSEEKSYQKIDRRNPEEKFEDDLDKAGLKIISIGSDGNCLFRAFSHQIYGTEDHHRYIRMRTMDYCEKEKTFFDHFIPEEYPSIEDYIRRQRLDGVWGDNLEIQILTELYR